MGAKQVLKWFLLKLMCQRGIVGVDIGSGETEPTEEEAGLPGEDQVTEPDDQEVVEYELDEDGEPVLDEDGNPVPKQSEGDEEETDEKGKPDHKKGAQERIQELANKNRELSDKMAALEAKFDKEQAEKPDFIEPDMAAVNAWLEETDGKIAEFKLSGDFVSAKKLEQAQNKLLADLEENDKKKTAYQERQGKVKTAETAQTEFLGGLKTAEEMYRAEMGIDPAVWTKMGEWFAEQLKEKKTLVTEFTDLGKKSPISAIRFAHEYTIKNMGVKEKASIDKKNKDKETASSASPRQGTDKSGQVDLSKALEEAKATNSTEGWMKYQAVKRAAKR